MGRGKKKDKKKSDDVPSLSSLSISEGASTSGTQESVAPKPEAPVPTDTPEAITAAPKKPVPEPEDEGGLGLGLGDGKKRKPRKKKESTPPAAVPVQLPIPQPQLQQQATPQQELHLHPQKTAQPLQTTPVEEQRLGAGAVPKSSREGASQQHAKQEQSTAWGGRGRGQPVPWSPPTTAPEPSVQTPTQPIAEPAQAQSAPDPVPVNRRPQRQSDSDKGALCRFKIPIRVNGNTVPAQKIRVLTNYLPMTINPKLKVHRYDVIFKPEIKKLIPKAFMAAKNKDFKNTLVAFDQMKNCYTIGSLPGTSDLDRHFSVVQVEDNNNRIITFEVSFKFTGIVCFDTITNYMKNGGTSLNPPMEAIQCIDVILRQGTLMNYVKAGRQFFKKPLRPIDLGGGLEIWTGLFQSAIFTSKSFINIDVAHKGFPKNQPLLDAYSKDFKLDPSRRVEEQQQRSMYSVEQFRSFLKGLRVIAKMIGKDKTEYREFIANDLVKPANQETFEYIDPVTSVSQTMTVADFFQRTKGIKLRYPYLNCVWVGPKNKTIYYPIEMLSVAYGQARNRQLNDLQLRTMVTHAATPPSERKRKIEEVIKDMNYPNNPDFKQFGLDISDQFYEVDAKVLRPPRLDTGGGKSVEPRRGEWRATTVLKPGGMVSWGMVAIEVAPNSGIDFEGIISMTRKVAQQMGIQMGSPDMTQFNKRMCDLQSTLIDARDKRIRFMFVIVGARGRDLYHKVKQVAERQVGILTQCIKEQTAERRMAHQTIYNILLKVNSKLMGVNQALSRTSMPRCLQGNDVMVVGADVTHPSPDQAHIPSIAAVTASLDPECYIYNIELSVQTPKKEMIVQFEDMMVDHLKIYKQRRNALPKKIFVFRDGVSEGQFAQVMNSELQAVHTAYHRMTGSSTIKPQVLFLLVQKRHHTRLFLKNSDQNVEPGTVVDKDIVHASELDFYLVSHQAIKGTARPTRYHAVCNDGNLPHDEVEQLTYYLCHLFSRCMRAVSYPTPTYYAHLACFRARSLTFGERFDNQELERQPKRLRVMDNILQLSRMFFV